jgi:hypothetical protein
LIDRFDKRSDLQAFNQRIPLSALSSEVSLGFLAAASGLGGIVAFLFLPIYTVARSTAVPVGGVSTSTVQGATGLDVGLAPGGAGTLAVVAICFVMVAVGSTIHVAGHEVGRGILVIAASGVVLVAAIGVLTIGTFLLPGVFLSLLAVVTAFRSRPNVRRTS